MRNQHRRRRPDSADRNLFLSEFFNKDQHRSTVGSQHDPKPDHKTQMLCRQVERAAHQFFSYDCADEVLQGLAVDGVLPAPHAGHLMIRVIVPADLALPFPELLSRLTQITPRFRHCLTTAISRKRVPMISFLPVPTATYNGDQ